jgi:hypothetical protein
MKEDESLQAFEARCRITVTGAFPDVNANGIEPLQVDYFLRGLPIDIRNTVRTQRPKTMTEAVEQARFQTYLANEGKPKKRKAEVLNVADDENDDTVAKKKAKVVEAFNEKIEGKPDATTTKALLAIVDLVKQNNSSLNDQMIQMSKNFRTNPGNNFRRGKNNRFFKPNEYQAFSHYQQPGYNNYRNSEVRTRNNGIQWNQNNKRYSAYRNNVQNSPLNTPTTYSNDCKLKKTKRTCFKCDSPDHLIANCPQQDDRFKNVDSSNKANLNFN